MADRMCLQKFVREEMQRLFGIKADHEIVDAVPARSLFAGQDDVDCYINGGPPPLVDPLRPYWENVNHPWNVAIRDEFATALVVKYPILASEDITSIQGHFQQRLADLRKHLSQCLPRDNESEEDIADRLHATRMRKMSLARKDKRRKYVSDSLVILGHVHNYSSRRMKHV